MSSGYYFSMAGLTLDILGASFLAVEAVKLENLAKARDRFFLPLHSSLKPIPIRVVGDDEPATPHSACLVTLTAWFLFHFIGGAVIVGAFLAAIYQGFGINVLREALILGADFPWWAKVLYYCFGGICLVALVAVGPGEWMHKLLQRGSLGLVQGLHWIDRRTPDGTIGIVGLSLLILGFVGQMIGTSLSS